MNKFMAINVLVRVVESGGFTAAARKMGMSVSAVTKAIARLEDEIARCREAIKARHVTRSAAENFFRK